MVVILDVIFLDVEGLMEKALALVGCFMGKFVKGESLK
jgi:hypothetical protein